MTLARGDFGKFFAAMHGGFKPFRWQERLLDAVLDEGRWPDQIAAPTGSGKTAVIDVHVFAVALAVTASAPMPPRRLALVVGRRVLVDDQFEYACALADRLKAPGGEHPIMREIAEALWPLHAPGSSSEAGDDDVSPLVVARLRGGMPPSRRWRDHPTAAEVICATPDMWGSRLLFRGYGSTSRAWPREAGLLAIDSVVVVDEAHLSQQLLCTARRVANLVPVADAEVSWRPLQVVETTATPAESRGVGLLAVGVDEDDLADTGGEESRLRPRLTNPKPVELLPVTDWPNPKANVRIARAMADAVMSYVPLERSEQADTVGCFVNSVSLALAVAAELRERHVGERPVRVVTICGQIRPIDLDRLREEYPDLLSTKGDPSVDVIVSTQSLEVGVDVDFAAVVTELASGSAIAQRAGRANRLGYRKNGPVCIIAPANGVGLSLEPADFTEKIQSGPYSRDELARALIWLREIAATPDGLAPWNLRTYRPPSSTRHRELFQRPELFDAWHWARTSDDLAAEPELDLWLAEQLDSDDSSVGVVVRKDMPDDGSDAVRLIRALPPRGYEVFSASYRTVVSAFTTWRQALDRDDRNLTPIVRVRADDVDLLEWRGASEGEQRPRLRPGDIVVVDASVALFTPRPRDLSFSPPVVVGADAGLTDIDTADDVLEAPAGLSTWARRGERGGVVLRIEPLRGKDELHWRSPFRELADSLDAETSERDKELREIVRAWIRTHPRVPAVPAMAAAAAKLLELPTKNSVVVVHRGSEGQLLRVLVIDRRKAKVDEVLRQVLSPRGTNVLLEAHQTGVGCRAALFARTLSLGDNLEDVLGEAGLHHDDGKRDARFQVKLGAETGDALRAKSPAGSTETQRKAWSRASGLPESWRHEQRSVVDYWVSAAKGDVDTELAARLVGTSHGHGRAGFPHAGHELLSDVDTETHESAKRLFDHGEWDELVETTQRRYGVWGCAYLEAILRAADGQVSGEGS